MNFLVLENDKSTFNRNELKQVLIVFITSYSNLIGIIVNEMP